MRQSYVGFQVQDGVRNSPIVTRPFVSMVLKQVITGLVSWNDVTTTTRILSTVLNPQRSSLGQSEDLFQSNYRSLTRYGIRSNTVSKILLRQRGDPKSYFFFHSI